LERTREKCIWSEATKYNKFAKHTSKSYELKGASDSRDIIVRLMSMGTVITVNVRKQRGRERHTIYDKNE
jgi:hypothetical protein